MTVKTANHLRNLPQEQQVKTATNKQYDESFTSVLLCLPYALLHAEAASVAAAA
jgi:hypothetical protein